MKPNKFRAKQEYRSLEQRREEEEIRWGNNFKTFGKSKPRGFKKRRKPYRYR